MMTTIMRKKVRNALTACISPQKLPILLWPRTINASQQLGFAFYTNQIYWLILNGLRQL